MTWWLTAGALLGWGVLVCWIDRPLRPAWKTRNAYRWAVMGLVFLLWIISTKALLLHQELIVLIQSCR